MKLLASDIIFTKLSTKTLCFDAAVFNLKSRAIVKHARIVLTAFWSMFKLHCKRHYRNLATYSWCTTWREHVTKTVPARRRHSVGGGGGGAPISYDRRRRRTALLQGVAKRLSHLIGENSVLPIVSSMRMLSSTWIQIMSLSFDNFYYADCTPRLTFHFILHEFIAPVRQKTEQTCTTAPADWI